MINYAAGRGVLGARNEPVMRYDGHLYTEKEKDRIKKAVTARGLSSQRALNNEMKKKNKSNNEDYSSQDTLLIVGIACGALFVLFFFLRHWYYFLLLGGVLWATKPQRSSFEPWCKEKLKEDGAGRLKRWFAGFVFSQAEITDLHLIMLAKLPGGEDTPPLFVGCFNRWWRVL